MVPLGVERKGMDRRVINRYKNLYSDNQTVVVVNNIQGKAIMNVRLSLRQGDVPSMHWFAYGIDALINYLEKRLTGITIFSLPVSGPVKEEEDKLPPLEEKYKLVAYADDVKPAVRSKEEYILVDKASELFEKCSGCRLHRDPSSGKCKVLPLGQYKNTVTQTDIPCDFLTLCDHLDMVGVELRASYSKTRKVNGDQIQERVNNVVGPWRGGNFIPLTQRPFSINTYALSKAWF